MTKFVPYLSEEVIERDAAALLAEFAQARGIVIAPPIPGRLAKSRPSERSKISSLEDNSLEIGTGNFIASNREFIKPSREFAASRRESPTTVSIQPQMKSSFANFSACEITLATARPARIQGVAGFGGRSGAGRS
jgi:hypothetical protein